jgi:hypothetical protein
MTPPIGILNKQQCNVFFFKNIGQEGKTGPVWGLVPVCVYEGGDIRKGCRRVNMLKCYVLVYENGKMRPVETILRMGGIKGMMGVLNLL